MAGYFRNAHAALVMYDVTNTESLQSCVRWINDIRIKSGEDIPQILLGILYDMILLSCHACEHQIQGIMCD